MIKKRVYRPMDEIQNIFQITSNVIQDIISKYKIDHFFNQSKLYININDFYKIYTHYFNPSLFDISPQKKKQIDKKIRIINHSNLFQNVFAKPYKLSHKYSKLVTQSLNLYNQN